MELNKVLRYLIIGCLFATLFLPLPFFIFKFSYFPFIVGKNFVFRIIIEIIFASWAVLALRDPLARPKKSLILYSVLGFILTSTLATIFGDNPYRSFWSNSERMEGLITTLHLVAFILVLASVFRTSKIWKWFFHTAIAMGVYIGVYGLLQLGGALVINQGGARLDATFGNSLYLAIYMIFSIFFAVIYLVRMRSREERERMGELSLMTGLNLGLVYVIMKLNEFQNIVPEGTETP